MAKRVRETAAGTSIGAIIVLNKKGEHVATVQSHYSDAGRVTVDVWQESRAIESCCKRGDLWAQLSGGVDYKVSAWEKWHFQQGTAGGYGYDKFAAALAGCIIDGHTIADHCGQVPEAEKARQRLFKAYKKAAASGTANRTEWAEKARKIGATFANWSVDDGAYRSLYFEAGLSRLETLGYKVITAI